MCPRKCMILMSLFCVVKSEIRLGPLVKTDIGAIQGIKADDGDYYMFLGVPFAQINTSNPFGPAVPHPGFEETFLAYDDSNACPQRDEYSKILVGSFDCLNLNIFVPNTVSSENRLPVLAYIYGGSFLDGSYHRYIHGPKFLVKHDIIIVSINYRGGPYGFMCLDTPEVPGNQGLKDQILGLKWIKKHIDTFGGDKNKITIGGHSAGSVSTDFHLRSNSEKLYNQVIIQSGTVHVPVFNEPLKTAPIILADYLDFHTNNIDEALHFLAKTDPKLVITAAENLKIIDKFKPCIEKEFEGIESTLTQNWLTASVPKVKDMPILIGITNDEKCGHYLSEKDEDYLNLMENQLSIYFDVKNDFENMTDIIYQFFFGDEPVSAATRQSVVDFYSDLHFVYPVYKAVEKYLENRAGNIFLHVFSYIGKRNFIRQLWNATKCKSIHGDEMGYVFDISYMKHWDVPDEDLQMIERMTTIWTNFIKFGHPAPEKSDLLPVEWTPITSKSEIPYIDINTQVSRRSRPFHKRIAFWDLFFRANKHLYIAYPNTKPNQDIFEKPLNPKTEL